MDAYSGFEPQVGEIRAVRTFRLGPDGSLYPLFGTQAWVEGINTARCRAAHRDGGNQQETHVGHVVVDPDCSCGFYAYADEDGAAEYPHARHVLAVVACWGRVVAGTRGLRSQHARIEAIWMSPKVPAHLAALVSACYPSLDVYTDKAAMLTTHPPTSLDCYQPARPRESAKTRGGLRLGLVSALALGLTSRHLLTSNQDVLTLWVALLGLCLVAAISYARRPNLADKGRALLAVALTLWLLAPFAGPAGLLFLRLPLLQVGVLGIRQRMRIARGASQFPAEIR